VSGVSGDLQTPLEAPLGHLERAATIPKRFFFVAASARVRSQAQFDR